MKHIRFFIILLTFLSVSKTIEATEFSFEGFEFSIINEHAELYDYTGSDTKVNIPEYVNYNGFDFPVTRICNYAFSGCTGLTSIEIPTSVISIGKYAFNHCIGLTSIEIPASVTSIGDNAFCGCIGLTSIIIPESVAELSNRVFLGSGIKTVKILGTPKINSRAFEGYYGAVVCNGTFVENIKKYKNSSVYAFDIPFNLSEPKSNHEISNITFKCEDNPYYELEKVDISKYKIYVFDEYVTEVPFQVYSTDLQTSEEYNISGLKWGTKYEVTFGYPDEFPNGYSYIYLNYYTPLECSTQSPDISISVDANQTSAKVKVYASTYNPEKPENVRVAFGEEEYLCDKNGELKISNLRPNSSYTVTAYADYDGKTASSSVKSFGTKNIIGKVVSQSLTPTTAVLIGNLVEGDAKITESGFDELGKGKKFQLTTLKPKTSYSYNFYAITADGYKEIQKISFTTPALELSMLEPRCVSEKCAIVAAETNLSDLETKAGFQWKKYDAPTALKPSEAYAAIYEGQLEGYIKNLQSTYYNVRAFFEDADGNRTYTDWVMFDPTDFSFFEPTVHTYPIQSVSNNEVSVRGYVLAGSDPIISQGFQYWKTTGADSSQKKAPSADKIVTVTSSGQVMTTTINGLEPGTDYVLRSFVETAAGYTYGEEQTFATTGAAAIGYIEVDIPDVEVEIVGYYDLMGRRYDEPQKGFNIVVYSDGTSKKEFIKF